jgi:hypothetical protein
MRQEGYYWVKYEGKWFIAEWDTIYNEWHLTGSEYDFKDHDFEEINENRLVYDQIIDL